jgi:hypothetical protein
MDHKKENGEITYEEAHLAQYCYDDKNKGRAWHGDEKRTGVYNFAW